MFYPWQPMFFCVKPRVWKWKPRVIIQTQGFAEPVTNPWLTRDLPMTTRDKKHGLKPQKSTQNLPSFLVIFVSLDRQNPGNSNIRMDVSDKLELGFISPIHHAHAWTKLRGFVKKCLEWIPFFSSTTARDWYSPKVVKQSYNDNDDDDHRTGCQTWNSNNDSGNLC